MSASKRYSIVPSNNGAGLFAFEETLEIEREVSNSLDELRYS